MHGGHAFVQLARSGRRAHSGLMVATAPALPLSPVVRVPTGELLVVSGQIAERGLLLADARSQATSVLRTLQQILKAEGRTLRDVVRVGVFLADIADFTAVNEVYREFFAAPFPARTTVAVAGLPLGARVEMDVLSR
jgi:2-iminobutanoate/2-iminopropanoate deaminase